jgi:hypothetical protein
MRSIRIILLVLIIIGIGALATQKFWVPKLVSSIVSSEFTTTVVQADQAKPALALEDGRQCYAYSHEATASEPYTVTAFMDMTVKNGIVTGTKKGAQAGPDMTNGYTGTLTGTLDQNAITAVFSFTVEGSQNKEKEIYRTHKTGIEKLRYPLVEEDGMLVPDLTKEFKILRYTRADCVLK